MPGKGLLGIKKKQIQQPRRKIRYRPPRAPKGTLPICKDEERMPTSPTSHNEVIEILEYLKTGDPSRLR
jgi:hypothetical protein